MSKLKGVKTVKQRRVNEPPQLLAHEEQLRMAERIVQALLAVGIDCQLAEAASAH